MGIAFVCFMGIATVFVGLIFLIVITNIMSALCAKFAKPEAETRTPVSTTPAIAAASATVANKQEIIAAACAVIAEELGTDVKNIKVTSFKKL